MVPLAVVRGGAILCVLEPIPKGKVLVLRPFHWQVALGVEVDSRDDAKPAHRPAADAFERLAVAQAAGRGRCGGRQLVSYRPGCQQSPIMSSEEGASLAFHSIH